MHLRLNHLTAALIAAALVSGGAPAAAAATTAPTQAPSAAVGGSFSLDLASSEAVGVSWLLPAGTTVKGSDALPFQVRNVQSSDVVQVWETFAGTRSLAAWATDIEGDQVLNFELIAPLGGKRTLDLVVLRNGTPMASATVDYNVIDDAPIVKISEQPRSVRATVGGTAEFSAGATDSEARFLWQYRKAAGAAWVTPSAGNGTGSFLLRRVDGSFDRAQVRVIVSARGRSVTSNVATLTVVANKPVISKQPSASAKASVGKKVTLSVSATVAGGQKLAYQWQRKAAGTKKWTNVSGRTSATLVVKVAKKSAGDRYRVVVSSAGQAVTSRESRVVVAAAKTTVKIARVSLRAGKAPVVTVKASQAGTVKIRVKQNAPLWSTTFSTSGAVDSNILDYTSTKTVKVKKGQTVRVSLKKLHKSRTTFTVTATFKPASKAYASSSAKKTLKSAK